MSGPRFFVSSESISESTIEIIGADAQHLSRVRRCRVGDEITVADGCGNIYTAIISSAGRDRLVAEIVSRSFLTADPLQTVLFQALLKGSTMDAVIRAATELGAGAILPVKAERSIPRGQQGERDTRSTRWGRIAEAAAKQSRQAAIPEISPPLNWESALERVRREMKESEIGKASLLILDEVEPESEGIFAGWQGVRKVILFVGPEGGLTDREKSELISVGGERLTLGRSILRSETAATAALAVASHELRRHVDNERGKR